MLRIFFILITGLIYAFALPAQAVSLIRDAEIEHTIREYATPIFKAAGMTPEHIRLYIVNDSRLNAFVAAGDNIFINTGLLMRLENPNQLIGVIAHETGHITGGHLARMTEALRNSSAQAILATVLGVVAVAAGAGEAAGALIMGGQNAARAGFLAHNRGQEADADFAAYRYLETAGQSPRGMLEVFSLLQHIQGGGGSDSLAYLRTHPLYSERITNTRRQVETSAYGQRKDPDDWVEKFERMQAKLTGFINNPAMVIKASQGRDEVSARYARSIALYRQHKLADSLEILDELMESYPQDPYFPELAGQILLEAGKPAGAVGFYRRAVELMPDEALFQSYLGQALLASEEKANYPQALEHLRRAVRLDARTPRYWRLMAEAHGRLGDIGMAAWATAERYMLLRRFGDARAQAEIAARRLQKDSPAYLRTQDILDMTRPKDG